MFIFCVFVGSLATISLVMPHEVSQPSPAQAVISAGTVQGGDCILNFYICSDNKSLPSQWRGAAANGEVFSLRATQSNLQRTELCIQSKIKAECYELL